MHLHPSTQRSYASLKKKKLKTAQPCFEKPWHHSVPWCQQCTQTKEKNKQVTTSDYYSIEYSWFTDPLFFEVQESEGHGGLNWCSSSIIPAPFMCPFRSIIMRAPSRERVSLTSLFFTCSFDRFEETSLPWLGVESDRRSLWRLRGTRRDRLVVVVTRCCCGNVWASLRWGYYLIINTKENLRKVPYRSQHNIRIIA